MTSSLGGFDLLEPCGRTAVEHVAPLLARGRPHVDDPVGMTDHIELMFDHKE
jgi:hypothetical protein